MIEVGADSNCLNWDYRNAEIFEGDGNSCCYSFKQAAYDNCENFQ